MLYIGIDLGTSAVKLLLMDESGGILNIVSEEYPLFFPDLAGPSKILPIGMKRPLLEWKSCWTERTEARLPA